MTVELPAEAVLTRFERTKQGLLALFTEDGFLFSVEEDTFEQFGLREAIETGSPLNGGELRLLLGKSEQAHARQTALRLLSGRMYAQQDLYRRLCRKYDARAAAYALAEADRLGFLDDAAFARARTAALARKNRSRRVILRDLAEKGVDGDAARQAVEEYFAEQDMDGEEADEAALRNLLEKQYGRKLAMGRTQQVQAALARRGFGGAAIRRALEQWREENPAEDEENDW